MSSLIITKQTGNFFSLVLDGGSPIISEQNRLTTIGNFCNFKTANGANLILKQNILYSEITIITGGSHVPTSIYDLWLSLKTAGFFDGLGTGSGGGGVDNFTELLDTFSSYIGRDGQVLVVNESMQRIETVDISLFTPEEKAKLEGIETGAEVNIQTDWNESDPSSNAYLKNKPANWLNAVGSFHYADLATQTTPQAIAANVDEKLLNDALGAYTNVSNAPYGVSSTYNATTNQLDFSELSIGDLINFRIDLFIETSGIDQLFRFYIKFGIGSASEFTLNIAQGQVKTNSMFRVSEDVCFDIGSADIRDYPAEIWIATDKTADITINGWYLEVVRKNINVVDLPTSVRQDIDFGSTGGTVIDNLNSSLPNIYIQDQNLGQIKIIGTFDGVYHEYLFTGIKGYYGTGALQSVGNDFIEISGSGSGGSETTTTMGALINSATSATPNDTDFIATAESGGLLKKITWTDAKAFLKTYFDTIYTTTSAVASQITTALSGYATQSWVISQGYITNVITALGYTPEDVANKSTSVTTDAASNTKYPSVKSIYDWAVGLFQPKGVRITNATTTGSYAIDWNAADVWQLTLTGATTITDTNLPTGTATKVIELVVKGAFAITLPAYWEATPASGAYTGAKWNHFVISCINGTTSSEKVIYSNEVLAT